MMTAIDIFNISNIGDTTDINRIININNT